MFVTLPVTLTLLREERFEATIEVVGAAAGVSPSGLGASVRRLVRDPSVAQSTVTRAGMAGAADLADRVTVAASVQGVLVQVWGRTPEEAAHLAEALGPELAEVAQEDGRRRIILSRTRLSRPALLDRVIDALPGAFPKRADSVWVGFAGCVAGVFCAGMALLWDWEQSDSPRCSRRPRS